MTFITRVMVNTARICHEKSRKDIFLLEVTTDECMNHEPCMQVNMIKEMVAMEELEMILNTELVKQELTDVVESAMLSAETAKHSTRKEITRLRKSL